MRIQVDIGFGDAGTPERRIGLTNEFVNDASRQAIWLAFLKKNELEIKPLIEIVGKLHHHLSKPLIAAAELSLK